MKQEPRWVATARADIGLREIRGAPTAPRIAAWLQKLGAWWRDDETPWCGVAMAAWMKADNIDIPKRWYRARAWLDWGLPIAEPRVGAVAVFERGGGGHVGLVVGRDARDRLLILGGNQGNAVSIAPFEHDRLLGLRWPSERLRAMGSVGLPRASWSGESSRSEA